MERVRKILCEQIDESYKEFVWDECRHISTNPILLYRLKMGNETLPREAIMDGYDEDDDGKYISSYGEFEDRVLADDDDERIKQQVATGKAMVKNNIYLARNNPQGLRVVNRVNLNWDDGYVQNSIISGSGTTPDLVGTAENWFDPPDVSRNNKDPNKDVKLFVPKVYASSTTDVVYPKTKIGSSDYFFQERTPFVTAFRDDEFGNSSAMAFDKALNPEVIGFQERLNGVYAFNDIASYCMNTGAMFADVTAMVQMLNYFAHNVLTLLIPKQIVLVMDSWKGISIPCKAQVYRDPKTGKTWTYCDYMPNVQDPVQDIPDYNNKMAAVVQMMKDIVAGRLFLCRFGHFYLKMTINPAEIVINFVLYNSQDYRLLVTIPTIDNQILYDSEEIRGIYPGKFIQEQNPYWHVSRNHDTAHDVLMSLQANYYQELEGVHGGELEEFMRTYGIKYGDSQFDPNIKNELNVEHPDDLRFYEL